MVAVVAAAPVPVRIVRDRRESPARWRAALDRAIDEAVDVLVESVSGEAFVESASHPGTLYAVTRTTCTCPAAVAGDPVCKHRACYRAQVGELPLDTGPVAAGVNPSPRRCSWCGGAGRTEVFGVNGPIGFKPCPDCAGRGTAEPLAAAVAA